MRLHSSFFALLLCTSLVATAQQPNYRAVLRQGLQAYQAKDYPKFLQLVQQAEQLRPDQPTVQYYLAVAHSKNNQSEACLNKLARLAAMRLHYPVRGDSDFVQLWQHPRFVQLAAALDGYAKPQGKTELLHELPDREMFVEGVVWDAKRKVHYLSSYRKRVLVQLAADGKQSPLSQPSDSLLAPSGMVLDEKRQWLWVASMGVPEMLGAQKHELDRGQVVVYDLKTKQRVARYELPKENAPHGFGDLLLLPNGDVIVSDSRSPNLYRIANGSKTIEPWLAGGPFASLQGLCLNSKATALYVADYSLGIFRVDMASKAVSKVTIPDSICALGVDGLYYHKGQLIAIQNGVRPHRIMAYTLSADGASVVGQRVLAAAQPLWAEPTLGQVVGRRFVYSATSQWGLIKPDGSLSDASKLQPIRLMQVALD